MHVEHYKMADVKRLENEYTRAPEYECRDGRIDESRTKNNSRLGKIGSLRDLVSRRLAQVPHAKRKDLNVMTSIVITCPQELQGDPDKEDAFFRLAFTWCQHRYGRDNVLAGFIHRDETSPHMHVPVVPEKQNRISSKSLFTRGELSKMHTDFDRECEIAFGKKGLVKNGRTKGGYTTKELKERTKREAALKAREEAVEMREKAVSQREIALNASQRALESRERALEAAEAEYQAEVGKWLTGPPEAQERALLSEAKAWEGKAGKTMYERLRERVKARVDAWREKPKQKLNLSGHLTGLNEIDYGDNGSQYERG